MIEIELVQRWRYTCDRCGGGASAVHDNQDEGRAAAEAGGFWGADWMLRNSPRQTCYCPECVNALNRAGAAIAPPAEEDQGEAAPPPAKKPRKRAKDKEG